MVLDAAYLANDPTPRVMRDALIEELVSADNSQ